MYTSCKISTAKIIDACDPVMLLLVQNWGKTAHFLQQQELLLEVSYTPLLLVMALQYHRLYQISSIESEV